VSLSEPRSPSSEAYRALRTNLQFALLGRSGEVLLVTSAYPGEGKSTTAANLAVAMAQGGRAVILADTDLRRPSLHRFFGFPNNLGVTSLLLDASLGPADALRPAEAVPGLQVLTSGPLPPNPAEVLESSRTQTLLAQLRGQADVIILDSPPLLVVTDAAVLSTLADGTLLVLDSGATRVDAARKAIETLEKVGVRPIGAVVNKLDPASAGRYYYDYAYTYRYGAYYGGSGGDGDQGDGTGTAPTVRGAARTRPLRLLERLMQGFTSLLS
jgi:non-specific protein-tyrosine kinase